MYSLLVIISSRIMLHTESVSVSVNDNQSENAFKMRRKLSSVYLVEPNFCLVFFCPLYDFEFSFSSTEAHRNAQTGEVAMFDYGNGKQIQIWTDISGWLRCLSVVFKLIFTESTFRYKYEQRRIYAITYRVLTWCTVRTPTESRAG